MKYIINKQGQKYCLHCKRYDCICLPEGEDFLGDDLSTKIKVISTGKINTSLETKINVCKQKLPNGRIIKGEIEVPDGKWKHMMYRKQKKILLSNKIINKSFY